MDTQRIQRLIASIELTIQDPIGREAYDMAQACLILQQIAPGTSLAAAASNMHSEAHRWIDAGFYLNVDEYSYPSLVNALTTLKAAL